MSIPPEQIGRKMLAVFLRRFDDPQRTAVELSYGRIAVGAAFLLAPRLLWKPQLKQPGDLDSVVVPLRMAGIRDLVLGLGALLAARRGAPLRGWLEAAAAADATDAALFATAKPLRPLPRWLSAGVAGAATYLGQRAARQLTAK